MRLAWLATSATTRCRSTSAASARAVYRVQMEQQCAVSGCQKVLFMVTKWSGDELVERREA
ncbi:hypothetical protein [Variovorax sp. IB41]|uniref:hypothetical protein n=1 Tax=Variovorax sp. IB41 TaxID=2779370 RepID=UPI001E30B7C9|nr:hypothetical protein [Variovorax sp. IB41]